MSELCAKVGKVMAIRKVMAIGQGFAWPQCYPLDRRFCHFGTGLDQPFRTSEKTRRERSERQGPQGRAAFSYEGAARGAWPLVPWSNFPSHRLFLSFFLKFLFITYVFVYSGEI